MAENQKNDVATTVADEIAGAEVIQFGKRDFNTYNRLISNIDRGFSKASEAYIAIGCSLWQIHHNEYYRIKPPHTTTSTSTRCLTPMFILPSMLMMNIAVCLLITELVSIRLPKAFSP